VSWLSRKAVPTGVAPTEENSAYWQKMSDRGAQGVPGPQGPAGGAYDDTGIKDKLTELESAISRMDYVILRQDEAFLEQVTMANVVYEIRHDFDLGGAEVHIPADCILDFKGGTLRNGTLVGDNTGVLYCDSVFEKINIEGSFNIPEIKSFIFKDITEKNVVRQLFNLTNPNVENVVSLDNNTYLVDVSEGAAVINITSNTSVILNGDIVLAANDLNGYAVFQIVDSKNVSITGSGKVIGDSKIHTGADGENGNGISVYSSDNIIITGIEIRDCWGDGIYFGYGNINVSANNVTIDGARRNGITVIEAKNVILENLRIKNIIGKNPQYAIDIEPNRGNKVENAIVRNVYVEDCVGGVMTAIPEENTIQNVLIENCVAYRVQQRGFFIQGANVGKIVNCSCLNNSFQCIGGEHCGLLTIENCHVENLAQDHIAVFVMNNQSVNIVDCIIKSEQFAIREHSNIVIRNCDIESRFLFSRFGNLVENAVIDGNTMRSSIWTILKNARISNNLIESNGTVVLNMLEGSENLLIYDNIIKGENLGSSNVVNVNSINSIIHNNIISSDGSETYCLRLFTTNNIIIDNVINTPGEKDACPYIPGNHFRFSSFPNSSPAILDFPNGGDMLSTYILEKHNKPITWTGKENLNADGTLVKNVTII
jgi:hypothetical protein